MHRRVDRISLRVWLSWLATQEKSGGSGGSSAAPQTRINQGKWCCFHFSPAPLVTFIRKSSDPLEPTKKKTQPKQFESLIAFLHPKENVRYDAEIGSNA
jgi:hypothetical protein